MFNSGLFPPRLVFPVLAAFAASSLPTLAHEAPSGWKYPMACCSNYDCREVSDSAILERPEGYVIKTTGEVIPMTDRKVRDSPDGQFHWCSVAGRDDSRTICLFVPPRSF
jgi:hypothetical protein